MNKDFYGTEPVGVGVGLSAFQHELSPAMLRDYFAAKALPSLALFWMKRDPSVTYANIAEAAYHMADAMLRARERKS